MGKTDKPSGRATSDNSRNSNPGNPGPTNKGPRKGNDPPPDYIGKKKK